MQIDKSIFLGDQHRREAVFQDKVKLEAISLEIYDLPRSLQQVLKDIEKVEKMKIPGVADIEGYETNKYLLVIYLQKHPSSLSLSRFLKNPNRK